MLPHDPLTGGIFMRKRVFATIAIMFFLLLPLYFHLNIYTLEQSND